MSWATPYSFFGSCRLWSSCCFVRYNRNMSSDTIPDHLPSFLHQFFWDVDASRVNPQKSTDYVIQRLLDKGNLEAARWWLQAFPQDALKDTLKSMKGFSPKSARFWALYLGVSEKEVVCLDPSYLNMRRSHWAY